MTKWLITGGCGFIGRNLVKSLIEEGGHFIRVVDNLRVGSREDLSAVCSFEEIPLEGKIRSTNIEIRDNDQKAKETNPKQKKNSSRFGHSDFENSDFEFRASGPKVQLIVADILDASIALELCQGIDVIVHLAANTGVAPSVADPVMDCRTNVLGTLNYLEAARHCKALRFVFASSGVPVGEVEPPIHEELAPHPVSPYGASKLAGEGYCSAYFRTFGVETVCLRFGNVYGPLSGKKDSVVAKFIKQALAGETVEIYGDGTQTRDFIDVSDLIGAIRLAASKPDIGGETFQIATSREHTVNEVAAMLQKELKAQKDIDMKITHGQPRPGDVRRNFSDISKAREVLGWESSIGLEEGISKVVEWFSKQTKSIEPIP
ncbi:NAD-dependent epimerase/dehydratase family protein [Desulfoglaeba alkanexedens]|uniref:NAD-dependent epimerase/dehydratase family protein n=1 Tax=Desulfoglaeba alkanexedens ALDC TaxID=980445 RepID=A0A4P8KZ61_9BACT|nr:GDP-mannose 4,6-dehydratase [Desulfoglaeba alkanexedens]QCQ20817.1 NAD-dependent epimerase/dehydratase family protein [Desulfoglaeba alkanexedens ALDC]